MKKFLLLTLFSAIGSFLQAQCTIDSTVTNTLTAPQNSIIDSTNRIVILPPGYVGQPYSEELQFKVPTDTLGVSIEYFRIDSILGLPPEYTLSCSNNSCTFDGGGYGCLNISGTATQPDSNQLVIYITLKTSLPNPASLPLQSDFAFYVVVRGNTGSLSSANTVPVRSYPNPASSHLQIQGGSKFPEDVTLKVLSITGEVLEQRYFERLDEPVSVGVENFRTGLYFYSLQSGQQRHTGRFTVSR